MDTNIVSQEKLPYVFNGMVYSTFGIQAYESLNKNPKNISNNLLDSIAKNVDKFNKHGWSYYDLYGNSNNIKYHLVHTSLLDFLVKNDFKKLDNKENIISSKYILEEWNEKKENLGFNYLMYGDKVFAYYHYFFSYIISLIIGFVLVFIRRTKI